mmetsp:Transcript_3472/g.5134  ORF Transcript_3472/g.5134 Transcript_3472/m.5134 type:complete len:233 (+) Transcript_3472:276-974(+)
MSCALRPLGPVAEAERHQGRGRAPEPARGNQQLEPDRGGHGGRGTEAPGRRGAHLRGPPGRQPAAAAERPAQVLGGPARPRGPRHDRYFGAAGGRPGAGGGGPEAPHRERDLGGEAPVLQLRRRRLPHGEDQFRVELRLGRGGSPERGQELGGAPGGVPGDATQGCTSFDPPGPKRAGLQGSEAAVHEEPQQGAGRGPAAHRGGLLAVHDAVRGGAGGGGEGALQRDHGEER